MSLSKVWAEVVGGKNPQWPPSATLKTTLSMVWLTLQFNNRVPGVLGVEEFILYISFTIWPSFDLQIQDGRRLQLTIGHFSSNELHLHFQVFDRMFYSHCMEWGARIIVNYRVIVYLYFNLKYLYFQVFVYSLHRCTCAIDRGTKTRIGCCSKDICDRHFGIAAVH